MGVKSEISVSETCLGVVTLVTVCYPVRIHTMAGPPEDCKLFVYGVSIRTPKEELQAEFEKFGEVLDAYNSGKGYAFITYQSKQEAEDARDALNGQTVCGQEIKVDVAKPRGSGRPRGPGRGGERGRGGRGGERGCYSGGPPRGGYGRGRGGDRGFGGRGRGRGGERGAPRGVPGGMRGGGGGQGPTPPFQQQAEAYLMVVIWCFLVF